MVEIQEALGTLLTTVSVAVLTAVGAILVTGIGLAKDWAIAKISGIQDENARKAVESAVGRVTEIVSAVVMSIEQEEKQEILKAMEDGNVSRDELVALKDVAIQRVKTQLLPETLDLLEESFGDVTEYIADKVSQQVFAIKNTF